MLIKLRRIFMVSAIIINNITLVRVPPYFKTNTNVSNGSKLMLSLPFVIFYKSDRIFF